MNQESIQRDPTPDAIAHGPESLPVPMSPPIHDEEAIHFPDLVHFLRRQWKVIMLAALVAGLLTFVVAVFLIPKTFQASATLTITPPRISSELKPQPMSIQGYQRLLESDAVVGETIRRLIEAGEVREATGKKLKVGDELHSRIYVSQRVETTLAPILEVIARGSTAEKAATIANTWADVFLERAHRLQIENTTANIAIVDSQYYKSYDDTLAIDNERLAIHEDHQTRLAEATIRWRRTLDAAYLKWDHKLLELREKTEDTIAAFQLDTRSRLEDFVRSQGLAVTSDSLSESRAEFTADRQTENLLLRTLSLRIQLAQSVQFVTLEKAISNDALWQATVISQNQSSDIEPLSIPKLLTQEINPVYTDLAMRLSEVEFALEDLPPPGRETARQIAAGIERIQRQRSSDLTKLFANLALAREEMLQERSREIEQLRLEREREIDNMTRKFNANIQQIDRRLDQSRNLLAEMALRYNQAEIARGIQDLADVRIAAQAVPPLEPRSSRVLLKLVIGVFLGALTGVLIALVTEVDSR